VGRLSALDYDEALGGEVRMVAEIERLGSAAMGGGRSRTHSDVANIRPRNENDTDLLAVSP
jgi:hypothetical protein